jgi:TRAP-type C4-dicarboxylate transport system permease small subunit
VSPPRSSGPFARLDLWSSRASIWLYRLGAYGALPALLVLVTLDVLLRYLLNAPLQWSRDVSGLLLLIAVLGALPHAWDRGYHVRMEILYARLGERGRSIADVVSVLSGAAFFLMLAVQALRFARYMFVTGETGENLGLPLWPLMLFVAVCAVVLVARLIANPRAEHPADTRVGKQWI